MRDTIILAGRDGIKDSFPNVNLGRQAEHSRGWWLICGGGTKMTRPERGSQPGPGRIEIYTAELPSKNDRGTGSHRSNLLGYSGKMEWIDGWINEWIK